jgi:hypothetical protein
MKKIKKVHAGDKDYYYHRPTGKRITAEFGTPAFEAAVRDLDAAIEPALASHTLGSLVAAYLASPEFGRLADATKRDYRRVFEYLKPIYPMPLSQVTGAFALSLRDKAFGRHKRRFANYVVQVLRLLFSWGVPRDFSSLNPAMGTPLIRKPKGEVKGNRPWTVEEFYILLDVAKGGMRVAIALGGYAAVSEGDMLILTGQNLRGHVLEFVRKKTGVPVHQSMHGELVEILAALPPVTADEPQNLVLNAWGKPFTGSGFRASFFKLVRKLHVDGPNAVLCGLRSEPGSGHSIESMLLTIPTRAPAPQEADIFGCSVSRHRPEALVPNVCCCGFKSRARNTRFLRLAERPIPRPAA